MTPAYLELMSARLSSENPKHLFKALAMLAEKPRRKGETALLDLGSILSEIKWEEAMEDDQ